MYSNKLVRMSLASIAAWGLGFCQFVKENMINWCIEWIFSRLGKKKQDRFTLFCAMCKTWQYHLTFICFDFRLLIRIFWPRAEICSNITVQDAQNFSQNSLMVVANNTAKWSQHPWALNQTGRVTWTPLDKRTCFIIFRSWISIIPHQQALLDAIFRLY